MRLLELFCGTKSIGKEFEKVGFEVTSLDFQSEFEPTYDVDILTLPDDFFNGFDAVWASPPCTAFSVASLGHHWTGGKGAYIPKTEESRIGIAILEKTVAIIKHVNPKMFWIENPRGMMRKQIIMSQFHRDTVTYCKYGDTRMKPTDIWHNTSWTPRPHCNNGDPCHESAPRGSRTGTQGIKGAKDRSVIPAELCRELAEYAAANINVEQSPRLLF